MYIYIYIYVYIKHKDNVEIFEIKSLLIFSNTFRSSIEKL